MNQCSAIELETKGLQCCAFKTTTYVEEGDSEITETCNYITDPLEIGKDEMQTENGKIIFKEVAGFSMFSFDTEMNFTYIEYGFNCMDDKLNMRVYKDNYIEEEKTDFKSDSLCLIRMMGGTEEEITPKKCYHSIVASKNEGSGVSWGFSEYTLNFLDGNST